MRQLPLQHAGFRGHRIQQAQRLLAPRLALGVGAAVAEQALEHHLRVVLHRQRRRGALPRDRVAIGAAEAVAAVEARLLDHQLQRRHRRVLALGPRHHLIHRDAELRLGAGLGERAAQERGGRAVVVGRGAAAIGQRVLEAADNVDLVVERLERLQDLGQLEPGAGRLRRPLVHDGAVRDVDRAEAGAGLGGRLRPGGRRRHHRVEERQRQRDAGAAQEGPPRQVGLAQERHGGSPSLLTRIRNGALCVTARTSDEKRLPSWFSRRTMARTADISVSTIGRPIA